MKSHRILSVLLLIPVFPLTATGAPTFSNASIQGQYKCTLTAYSLPPKANQPFAAAAMGDLTFAADGNGKFTAGTWDHTIDAPGVHAGCKLTLSTGTYSINADGSGSETTKWQLMKGGSSPECDTYFPGSGAALGADVIITDPAAKIFYASNINPFAILAVACQK